MNYFYFNGTNDNFTSKEYLKMASKILFLDDFTDDFMYHLQELPFKLCSFS